MRIVILIIAPGSVIATAEAWARRGLLAEALWINSDNLAEIDLDRPNVIEVSTIALGKTGVTGPLGLEPHPRISVFKHLWQFIRFIPVGVINLFKINTFDTSIHGHLLEFADLGYAIGPARRRVSAGVPNFVALENAAIARAKQEVEGRFSVEGGRPVVSVWDPVCRLTTSLIDGGSGNPPGWETPISQELPVTIDPEWVLIKQHEPVTSEILELQLAENYAVAAEALRYARLDYGSPINVQSQLPEVTATASRLASQVRAADATRLSEQLNQLGHVEAPERPLSLLERLRAAVVGGLIRSRLDAERWEWAATSHPPGKIPDWAKAVTPHRILFAIFTILMTLWLIIWNADYETASQFVYDLINREFTQTEGNLISAGIVLLGWLIGFYFFYRTWATVTERGRRRLELLDLWLQRAKEARKRSARQVNTERITRAWVRLLSEVPNRRPPRQTEDLDAEPELAPMSMRIGHPSFAASELQSWLSKAAAKSGWRWRALNNVIAKQFGISPDGAVDWLAEDRVESGGHINELEDHLARRQEEARYELIESAAETIKQEVMGKAKHVSVQRHPDLPTQKLRADTFLAELVPATDAEDDWPDDDDHSWLIEVGYQDEVFYPQLALSPTLCDGVIRIQVMGSRFRAELPADEYPKPSPQDRTGIR